jgi:hypothetical protein
MFASCDWPSWCIYFWELAGAELGVGRSVWDCMGMGSEVVGWEKMKMFPIENR